MGRVFFFQPLNWLASRRLAACAELLADDWAAQRTTRPLELAECLTAVARWTARPVRALPAAAAITGTSDLKQRIERLVRGEGLAPAMKRPVWAWPIAWCALAALTLLAPTACGVAEASSRPAAVPSKTAQKSARPAPPAVDILAMAHADDDDDDDDDDSCEATSAHKPGKAKGERSRTKHAAKHRAKHGSTRDKHEELGDLDIDIPPLNLDLNLEELDNLHVTLDKAIPSPEKMEALLDKVSRHVDRALANNKDLQEEVQQELRKARKEIRKELAKARKQMKASLGKDALPDIRRKAQRAAEESRQQAAEEAREQAREHAEQARERAREQVARARDQAREREREARQREREAEVREKVRKKMEKKAKQHKHRHGGDKHDADGGDIYDD
jgi:hypothetical protein